MTDTTDGLKRTMLIQNKRGLHARASAKFVGVAGKFQSEIRVAKDGVEVCARSIMGLMMLAAAPGDSIFVWAIGPDAESALDAIEALISDKFGEE